MKFEELLSDYGIVKGPAGHHHCRPGWINIDCPFCSPSSNKWHLGYNINSKFFMCWKCGWHSITETIAEVCGLSFSQASKIEKGLDDLYIPKEIKTGKLILPKGLSKLLKPHKKYLKKRGYDYSKLEKYWEIKGIGIQAHLSWRIFIPVFLKNEVVTWTTRSIGEPKAKYINAPPSSEKYPIKNLLYGEDYVHDTVIIVEGPFDVWRIGPGAVCTFGTGFSTKQLEKLITYKNRYICYDAEPTAQKKANKLCDYLSVFDGDTSNIILDSGDPDTAKDNEIKELKNLLKS